MTVFKQPQLPLAGGCTCGAIRYGVVRSLLCLHGSTLSGARIRMRGIRPTGAWLRGCPPRRACRPTLLLDAATPNTPPA